MSQEIYSKGSSQLAYGPIMSTITKCIYLESSGEVKIGSHKWKKIIQIS